MRQYSRNKSTIQKLRWKIAKRRHKKILDDAISIASFRGCKFYANHKNKIEKLLLKADDSYDLQNFELINNFLNTDDVCFDIGGNIGVYTTIFSKLSGNSNNIHSFEPVPYILKKLKANAKLNGFTDIHANNFALGEANKEQDMYQVKEGVFRGGVSTFVKNENIDKMGQEEFDISKVSIRTLDEYVNNTGLKNLNFMKIDVEGFEWNVLSGGKKTISELRPYILMEFTKSRHYNGEKSAKDFKNYFEKLQYSAYEHIILGGELVLLPYSFEKPPRSNNIFLIG